MDDIVRKAMSKWPHVPACYGWLGLDSRGQWHMRDDRVQALGLFQSGTQGAKGSVLRHEKLIEFIQRNYEVDEAGRWYFQNGPQRVFVELEVAPWVWRLNDALEPVAPGGQITSVDLCLLDEQGRVYLHTPMGLGLVHTLDVHLAAQALEAGLWPLQECDAAQLPKRFGFVLSPQAQQDTAQKG